MLKQIQVVKHDQVPAQEGFFGVVTPAMVYNFLRENADLSNIRAEYAVPVALPGSERIFEDFFNAKMVNGYFVQTIRPETGDLVDAGIVTANASSPDIYVVTAFSDFGEYSKYPFTSKGGAGSRSIQNKKLSLELDVTIEDILQFGCTWTPEQREDILKSAVRQHYKDLFPTREIKALPAGQKYLPK